MWEHNSQMHKNVHDKINGTKPTQWVGEWKDSVAQEHYGNSQRTERITS